MRRLSNATVSRDQGKSGSRQVRIVRSFLVFSCDNPFSPPSRDRNSKIDIKPASTCQPSGSAPHLASEANETFGQGSTLADSCSIGRRTVFGLDPSWRPVIREVRILHQGLADCSKMLRSPSPTGIVGEGTERAAPPTAEQMRFWVGDSARRVPIIASRAGGTGCFSFLTR